ncbi:hypothetical protein [Pseudoxanthomonas sp. SE1]|uniref:hypothetical protein n=1 Tax=Pseudoxanthomonas sp. SE1 TaxID=1664560 RepID=UPI00240D5BD0|nr:hypothetical protein [Pseudoxanthomonas sp. SE1]WFC40820.1 hypothetical protein OY559_13500 [Pseudoxanthomonas sp. SE1]
MSFLGGVHVCSLLLGSLLTMQNANACTLFQCGGATSYGSYDVSELPQDHDDPPDHSDPPNTPGDGPDKPDDGGEGDEGEDDGSSDPSLLGRYGATEDEQESGEAIVDYALDGTPLGKKFSLEDEFETTLEMTKRFSGDVMAMKGFQSFKDSANRRGFGTGYEEGVETAYKLEPGIDFAVDTLMSVLDAMVVKMVIDSAGMGIPAAALYFSKGRSTLQAAAKEAALAVGIVGLQLGHDAADYIGEMINDSLSSEREDYEKMERVNPGIIP